MGGYVPLGYEVRERKLLIIEDEARMVRELFQLYAHLGTVALVKAEAEKRGYRTRLREDGSGRQRGGGPITRGHLYKLLSNPVYAGRIAHKHVIHEGEHDAIVDPELWDEVQQKLASQARRHKGQSAARHASLLAGMIVDADGVLLTPSHANKKGKRYRYYVSRDIIQHGSKQPGWRIPASEIEGAVKRAIASFLSDGNQLTQALMLVGARQYGQTIERAVALVDRIDRHLLMDLGLAVALCEDNLTLSFGTNQVLKVLGLQAEDDPERRFTIDVPLQIRRRGVEMKLVIGGGQDATGMVDPTLLKAIARGHAWFEEITAERPSSISEIANREGVTIRYVSQHLDFAFLAPPIVERILSGRQPVDLTLQSLKQVDLPLDWNDQARILGIN